MGIVDIVDAGVRVFGCLVVQCSTGGGAGGCPAMGTVLYCTVLYWAHGHCTLSWATTIDRATAVSRQMSSETSHQKLS